MTEKLSTPVSLKKIKIDYSSVNVEGDLSVRQFLGELLPSERPILEELLYSSARIPIDELAESLEMSRSDIEPALAKFEAAGLLTRTEEELTVSKEMRRTLDIHFPRTEPDFAPDVDFALGVLKVLPVQHVPLWYALPKTSTNLKEALIEKFFLTPALYRRHLELSQFDNPQMQSLLEQMRREPTKAIDLSQFNLEGHALHELILHLELNFIGFLAYRESEGLLKPMLCPLREYSTYCERIGGGSLFASPPKELEPMRPGPFPFLRDLDRLTEIAEKRHISLDNLSSLARELGIVSGAYIAKLCDRAQRLRLVDEADGELIPGANLEKWRRLSEDDRPFCYLRHKSLAYEGDEKSVRAAEKSMETIADVDWITFESFMSSALIPLRPEIEVRLSGRARASHYAFPNYTDEERALVHHVIFNALAEAGFVETSDEYFRLSAFGKLVFGPSD